jgi:hypothetical protein
VPPSSQAALQEIAVKIAEKVSKAGCDSSKCVLLNFYTSSETTSRVGLKLSDEFAALLAKNLTNGIVVIGPTFANTWTAIESH